MNWYKTSSIYQLKIDRENIIKKINKFKQFIMDLSYIEDYIPQNPPDAKNRILLISRDKMLSSYPDVVRALSYAASKALDSYKTTYDIVKNIVDIMYAKIKALEEEKKVIMEEKLPEALKKYKNRK